MNIILKNIVILLVFLGILNGLFSFSTKGILKKFGFTTFPFISQISDIKKLKQLIEKDILYKILYYAYLITVILIGIDVIAILILIIVIASQNT